MFLATDKKEVTYKHLKKGDTLQGWIEGNCHSSNNSTVIDVNPAFVTVMVFDKWEKKVSSEGTRFLVPMTEAEIKAKYKVKATEIMKGLLNKLADYEIGPHEQWNSWVHYDIYEMAQSCLKHNLTVLGYCLDVYQRHRDDSRDLGICVQDEDGDKFWCHANADYTFKMIHENLELLGENRKFYCMNIDCSKAHVDVEESEVDSFKVHCCTECKSILVVANKDLED